MACSYCGREGHNIQTCTSVRHCGHCGGRGHDRRNCPELVSTFSGSEDKPASTGPLSLSDIRKLCRRRDGLLVHMYWPRNVRYFERNLKTYSRGGGWQLVATPGHGVGGPERPTLNFLVADDEFTRCYEEAAASRGIEHGIILKREALEDLSRRRGYDFAEVQVGHPHGHGYTNPKDFWRFDIGNRRYGALHALQYATVVRFATPEPETERGIELDHDEVVGWW